jgi:hypothetical protein
MIAITIVDQMPGTDIRFCVPGPPGECLARLCPSGIHPVEFIKVPF